MTASALDNYELAQAGVPGIYADPDEDWAPWLLQPAVAATTGALALAAGIGGWISGAATGPVTGTVSAVLCAVLVVLAAIDLKTMLLPGVIVGPLYALVPLAALAGTAGGEFGWDRVGTAALCAVAFFAFMWLLTFLTGGFGDGDVNLIGVLGFVLGLHGVPAAILGAVIAPICLGGLAAVPLMLLGRGGRAAIPFGPFLAAGTITVLCFPQLAAAWVG